MKLDVKVNTCCNTPEKAPITKEKKLPVAIIGGGPVGLAAAAHLAKRGESFFLLEAGEAGANVLSWGHVRLFSPWRYNIDKAAAALLKKHNWQEPELDTLPFGKELVDHYLSPLSNLSEIKPFLHTKTKVLSVGKKEIDKMKTAGRDSVPFVIYAEKEGNLQVFEAKAVIDATGTWGNPNPAVSSGIWQSGEKELSGQIYYGIPDIAGKEKERYAKKRTAVIGGGHSAVNALLELAELKETHPEMDIVWVMRKQKAEDAYGGEEKDALAARGALGSRVHQLVDAGVIEVQTPFFIQSMKKSVNGIDIIGTQSGETKQLSGFDEIIVSAGSRPDLSIISELRTSIDSATESVSALSPLIDPNVHSCGTVRPHGEKELRQPEKNFYMVGAKSYGRAPTFLMATGYEQVRSVVAQLCGDFAAAEKVELDLPETGVCSVNVSKNSKAESCCS
ncbi:FAD-dependent oxidoreductase [Metabacillus sp. JX24]|uniref:FAD-dependent oxidoreductase n=1 Tax=Metabacillus sp. JX24 TaxID=3240759 RepID=UPI00351085A7